MSMSIGRGPNTPVSPMPQIEEANLRSDLENSSTNRNSSNFILDQKFITDSDADMGWEFETFDSSHIAIKEQTPRDCANKPAEKNALKKSRK